MSTPKGENTKKKICEVTLRLINRDGYSKITISDICREAGVSNGSFFHHFKTKDDVLVAYVERESQLLNEYYETLKDMNVVDTIKAVMAWQAQYYQLKGEEFIAHLYSHLILSKQELTFNYSLMQILEACFTKGQNEGIFISHYAPEHMAKLMFQSLLAQTAFGRWDTEDGGIEGQIKGDTQQVLDLFIAMERA